VYPGADLPLALGCIREWKRRGVLDESFLREHTKNAEALLAAADGWPLDRAAEESHIPKADLEVLIDRFEKSNPALLRCGWGLERNRNGGQAVAAILAIPALLGKFGVRAGGYTLSNSGAGGLIASELWDPSSWSTRGINMTELARVLEPSSRLDPPVKALFVYNANPVATVPDQNGILRGLARKDLFTVVFDQVMTDTARYADIVLPATTFLEHHDFKRAYGSYVVGASQPVIEPRGEARTNASVFRELARSMGLAHPLFDLSDEDLRRRVMESIELSGERLPPGSVEPGKSHRYGFRGQTPTPIQFENVHPATPDGRIDLTPACLGKAPYTYRPVKQIKGAPYPLALLSPATSKTVNSTLGEFNLKELVLSLHPSDARERGIATGERVRVFNELGEVECRARVDGRMREGVVHLPKGAWMKSSINQRTSTALTPSHVNEVGGGACFNDARVEVERSE
jgi:anaerobic selenocysteine-containing dehydrogenase